MSNGSTAQRVQSPLCGSVRSAEFRNGVSTAGLQGRLSREKLAVPSGKVAFVRVDNESISVLNPLDMVRKLLADGMSMASVELNVGLYFRCLFSCVEGAQKLQLRSPVPVAKRGLSVSKALRAEKWRREMRALAMAPGQCYLHAVRWGARRRYLRELGVCPKFRDFISYMRVPDLYMEGLRKLQVHRVVDPAAPLNFVIHVTDSPFPGGEFVGNLRDCIGSMLERYQRLNEGLFLDDYTLIQIPMVSLVGMDRPQDLRPFLYEQASAAGFFNSAMTTTSPTFAGVGLVEGEDVYVVGAGTPLVADGVVQLSQITYSASSVREWTSDVHALYVCESYGCVDVGSCRVEVRRGSVFLLEPGVSLRVRNTRIVQYEIGLRRFGDILRGMKVSSMGGTVISVAQRSNLRAASYNLVGCGEYSMVSDLRSLDMVVGEERAVHASVLSGEVIVFGGVTMVPGCDFLRYCTADDASIPVTATFHSVLRVGFGFVPSPYSKLPYLDRHGCVGRVVMTLDQVDWATVSSVVTVRVGEAEDVRDWLFDRSIDIRVRDLRRVRTAHRNVCVVGQLSARFADEFDLADDSRLLSLYGSHGDIWFVGTGSFALPSLQRKLLPLRV